VHFTAFPASEVSRTASSRLRKGGEVRSVGVANREATINVNPARKPVTRTERKEPALAAGSIHRVGGLLDGSSQPRRRSRTQIRLGLLLGLLRYGKAPKTLFRLPGLIRKKALNYGL
jgi:hypothetical protein